MKITLLFLSAAALAFVAFALWVRLAPASPARWHGDPATAPDPQRPHFARAERVLPLPPAAVRAGLDAIAAAEGAAVLADEGLHVTYVARTRLMRFPDFVSIRLDDQGDGTTRLRALSRARFGYSDMGLNAGRLKRWLARLED